MGNKYIKILNSIEHGTVLRIAVVYCHKLYRAFHLTLPIECLRPWRNDLWEDNILCMNVYYECYQLGSYPSNSVSLMKSQQFEHSQQSTP